MCPQPLIIKNRSCKLKTKLEDVWKKKNSFVYLLRQGHKYNSRNDKYILHSEAGILKVFFFLRICFKHQTKTAGTFNFRHAGNFQQSGISDRLQDIYLNLVVPSLYTRNLMGHYTRRASFCRARANQIFFFEWRL